MYKRWKINKSSSNEWKGSLNDLQAAILIQTLFISESCGRKEKDVVSTISRQRIMAVLSNVNHVGYISRQYSQTLVTTLSYRNANNFSLSLSSIIFSLRFIFFPEAESTLLRSEKRISRRKCIWTFFCPHSKRNFARRWNLKV